MKRDSEGTTKGAAIRFVAGKYAGKKGWLNSAAAGDDLIACVIVDMGKGGLKATYVYRASIREMSGAMEEPASYAQAALEQITMLERSLITTCRLMAQCDAGRDLVGFHQLFERHLDDAIKWQKKKGEKASYKKIEYS